MSPPRFGSQRARLILSGVGAVAVVALLCGQWFLAEFRRPGPEHAGGEPVGVGALPPAPVPDAPPVPPAPATQAAQLPPTAPQVEAGRPAPPPPADPAQAPAPAPLPAADPGQVFGAPPGPGPAAAEKPNVDQTAAIRTDPRPEPPPDARRPAERPASVAQRAAPESGPEPQSGEPSRADPPAAPAARGDLQTVVDQITRLRDEVRGVGEGIAQLREEVRADISRLEGKMQAFERRRTAAPPRVDTARSNPPRAPVSGSKRSAEAEPQTREAPASGGARAGAQALQRPAARDRRVTEAPTASRPAPPTRAASPAGAETEPRLSRREASAAPSLRKRNTIRRSAQSSAAAPQGRRAAASGGPEFADRGLVQLSDRPPRPSDQRYASFRPVEAAAGRPAFFRTARRSLRYRPLVECVR